MLSQSTIDIVKSTAPVIAETGPKLTAYFYDRMFEHHPELKDVFNLTHQDSGRQREALFNAICGYASNIDNIEVLLPVVEKIAQKHTSFSITPAQYDIVGEHLLATIDELLSPGQAVLDAWAEAYGLLAHIFIDREEAIYQEIEQQEGGWRGTREFKVVEKTKQSSVITSFVFEPVDGGSVIGFKPGQYLGIYLNSDTLVNQEIRQYSLSDKPNHKNYRISVKREDSGVASRFLHDSVQVGDIVKLTPPAGDFFYQGDASRDVALISAGVGLTPMLAMLESLLANDSRETGTLGKGQKIHWLHATDTSERHAFKDRVDTLAKQHDNLSATTWYCKESQPNCKEGFMILAELSDQIKWAETDFYFCGPVPFMQGIAQQLLALGVKEEAIHYECFGPHKVLEIA